MYLSKHIFTYISIYNDIDSSLCIDLYDMSVYLNTYKHIIIESEVAETEYDSDGEEIEVTYIYIYICIYIYIFLFIYIRIHIYIYVQSYINSYIYKHIIIESEIAETEYDSDGEEISVYLSKHICTHISIYNDIDS
jgi:hypothetical protein